MAGKRRKALATKPRALSLNIGLNTVSPLAYGGWSGPLAACEFDAHDLAALARAQGMKTSVLLTKKGTRTPPSSVWPLSPRSGVFTPGL